MSGERKKTNMPGVSPDGKLVCTKCGCKHFEVVNAYEWTAEGKTRRRQCRNCKKIVKTNETIV